MKIEFIDLKARYLDEKEQLNKIFNEVLESGQLILSDKNTNLEKNLSELLKKKYCVTLNSGTDALMLSLWALNIKKGDEVITPAVSFIATAAAKLAVPNRLCPQPCPAAPGIRASLTGFLFCEIPALASNSPKIPITGFPDPYFAINAVGISATFSVTSKPLSRA